MAKGNPNKDRGRSSVTRINDDDEHGSPEQPKEMVSEATGGNIDRVASRLTESTGADEEFVRDMALLRAVSMMPVEEDADEAEGKMSKGDRGGIPEGEKVVARVVRGTGDNRFLVVVTDHARKYVKAL